MHSVRNISSICAIGCLVLNKQISGTFLHTAPSPPLYPRHWTELNHQPTSSEHGFTVMQFNLLADSLSGNRPDLGKFQFADYGCLNWEFRKNKLLLEILRGSADIVCLQELDHYYDWLAPELQALGYSSVFMKKPTNEDGCAIFFRLQEFDLLGGESFLIPTPKSNQVAIILELRHKSSQNRFRIVTTHLKATKNEKGEEIRYQQIQKILSKLENLNTDLARTIPCIIAMDANAAPIGHEYPSLMYPLIKKSKLNLGSAYGSPTMQADSEPAYTTWKIRKTMNEKKHCIDYLLYSRNELYVHSIWSIPSENLIEPERIPSLRYPSDHFSLMAKFNWKPNILQKDM